MSEVGRNRPRRPKTGGRLKGTPNIATRNVRFAMGALLDGNIDNIQSWLEWVGRTDPARAIELFLRLLEFVTPKLHLTPDASAASSERRALHEMSIAELQALAATFDPPLDQ